MNIAAVETTALRFVSPRKTVALSRCASSSCPRRLALQMKQHYSRFRHKQHPVRLASGEIFFANAFRVAITEVDLFANIFRNPGRESHLRARCFNVVFECSDAFDVRAV